MNKIPAIESEDKHVFFSREQMVRYSVLLPYAKQRHVTTDRLILALPPEIGALV